MSELDTISLAVLNVVNFIALLLFCVLIGAGLASQLRRYALYRRAEWPTPVFLKRGLVLFGALGILGGEAVLLRVLGIDIMQAPFLRLLYVVQANIILLSALAYFDKTDLFDVNDPTEDEHREGQAK